MLHFFSQFIGLNKLSLVSMYTLIMHSKSFWPVQPTTNVQTCLSSKKLISYLFQGTFWATFDEIWQLSTLMLSLYGNSLSESIFQGGSEG